MAVEKIQYQAGNVTGHGALVWNEKVSGKRPLLLVMSNWLGVTDVIVKRAGRMAGDKYVAFVADMYGNGKTCEGPPTSQEWMMQVRADGSMVGEYPIPTPGAGARCIGLHSNGRMYVTLFDAGMIGEVIPDGSMPG